ncbi:DUF7342 family protein [Halorubrum halophilum]|uniref:DUF7342 family protein n=1 Tax=Halorubrum halophilum TaxID=413816 RepID=UPI000679D8E2|nr:hypothetical protein [Halorubrum halophilum]
MTDSTDGVSAWVDHTSALDRVRSIASTVSEPRPLQYIANEAQVSETTTSEYLARLVDLHVLQKTSREGEVVYSPDPLYTRLETIRELLTEHDQEELVKLRSALQSQLDDWREEYGVESPADLRTQAAESETAARARKIRKDAQDWELVAYRLSLVEEAIEMDWEHIP